MAVIMNPVPNMTDKELREVYLNRKTNHVEKDTWRNFMLKHQIGRRSRKKPVPGKEEL